jgi:hypothetical protein
MTTIEYVQMLYDREVLSGNPETASTLATIIDFDKRIRPVAISQFPLFSIIDGGLASRVNQVQSNITKSLLLNAKPASI